MDFPGEAYKVGLTSGGWMQGESGERSIVVYEDSGDGSGVLQWIPGAEATPGELDDDLLEGSRLILILEEESSTTHLYHGLKNVS